MASFTSGKFGGNGGNSTSGTCPTNQWIETIELRMANPTLEGIGGSVPITAEVGDQKTREMGVGMVRRGLRLVDSMLSRYLQREQLMRLGWLMLTETL
jgi:hypothetical protein